MRWLHSRAVAIVCSAVFCAAGCLTTQEAPSDDGGVEDPPITLSGGSGGSNSQGGDAGESTGGRERGGSGGTTSGGGSDSGCNDDSDCEARIDGRSKCSVPSGECVDCLVETDCASDEQCVDNDCRPQTSCTTSSDCPPSLVCDPSYRICVECVSSSDCAASETCLNDSNTCVERCSVDSHCAPSGQRCNGSYCVNCLSDSDCDGSRHCDDATSTCVRDVCVEGESNCENNSVVGCNDNGSMPLVPEPCLSNESCVEGASGATCEVRICTPSMATCSTTDETVLRCSEDGLTQEVEEDCADTMQLCYGGVCIDAVCTPNTAFCAGTEVRVCDSTGTMSSLQTTCQGTQRCNPATTMCSAQFCTPNQPACNGTIYTTCSADGFGYVSGGTDCSATDQFCGPTGCTTSAVDAVPPSPILYTSTGSYLMLNYYSVTSARNLALIEYYMNPASAITLTWLVYESTTSTGTYNRIHLSTTTSTIGEGYQSSGSVSVPLVAGRFYAIGASWSSATYFAYHTATASQATSFGALIGSYVTSGVPTTVGSPATTYFVSQRLTTVP